MNEAGFERRRKTIIGVGAAQILFGFVCLGLGIWILVYTEQQITQILFITVDIYITAGEGIWGSVWVILAGNLGIISSTCAKRPWVVNLNLAFSIFGCVTSAATVFVSLSLAILYLVLDPFAFRLELALAITSLVAMVLSIVGAVLCCCAPPTKMESVCGSKCCGDPDQDYYNGSGINNPSFPMSHV